MATKLGRKTDRGYEVLREVNKSWQVVSVHKTKKEAEDRAKYLEPKGFIKEEKVETEAPKPKKKATPKKEKVVEVKPAPKKEAKK